MPVIVKEVMKEFSSIRQTLSLQQEIRNLAKIKHKNFLRIYGVNIKKDKVYLIFENFVFKSLHLNLMRKIELIAEFTSTLTLFEKTKIIEQILDALQYLHFNFEAPIIYLNLNHFSILIDQKFEVKCMNVGVRINPLNRETDNFDLIESTLSLLPPQIFECQISVFSDIYQLGIFIFQLFTGKKPWSMFTDPKELAFKVKNFEIHDAFKSLAPRFQKAVRHCLSYEPYKRPLIPQIRTLMI